MTAPSGLRATLESGGGSLKSLTVLAPQNDPFRVDTPAGHRDAQWLTDKINDLGLTGPRHLRGLHYALIGQTKPNGSPYKNTDEDWTWLAAPAKAARWLGYLPFDRIVDQRNDEPEVQLWATPDPQPFISTNFTVTVPSAEDLRPRVWLSGFEGKQPYRIVLVGEKSSLRPILSRVARRYGADLYLPTGEISDTQAHTMAQSAANRTLAVFYFADCDPSGWQMPISLSRKLQALQAMKFPRLGFHVHRVGLTPEQVKRYGLPSTPLKDTERRATKWFEATGVEQTEIDAALTLQPQLVEELAVEAVRSYFDATLASRVREAEREWERQAQRVLDESGGEHLAQLRTETAAVLETKRQEIQELLDGVRIDPAQLGIELPGLPDLPPAEVTPNYRPPLVDSGWTFPEQCEGLIASKQYRAAGGDSR